jgi:hypothetical protein
MNSRRERRRLHHRQAVTELARKIAIKGGAAGARLRLCNRSKDKKRAYDPARQPTGSLLHGKTISQPTRITLPHPNQQDGQDREHTGWNVAALTNRCKPQQP